MDKLLRLIADSLCQSELPICQLDHCCSKKVGWPDTCKAASQSKITPLKFGGIDLLTAHAHMDLCEAILQYSADLSWRRPGFGKIRDDIASHMAVCEVIGPTGQIKHETVRLGLLFKHQTSFTPATATLRKKYIFL